MPSNSIFDHGSLWFKADVHLHTRADKEFRYDGTDDRFIQTYVEQLERSQTGIGFITNHNKFDGGVQCSAKNGG